MPRDQHHMIVIYLDYLSASWTILAHNLNRTEPLLLQPSIELVKRETRTLVRGIQEEYPAAALRVAFVGYRDYGEETDVIDFTPEFVADGSAFVTALARVRAQGGDDAPEDVFTGLERAAALGWRAQGELLRFLFIVS